MNQVKKFAPLLDQLFSLELIEDKHEIKLVLRDALQSWGDFNRGEYSHLYYSRMRWDYKSHSRKLSIKLSPDEYTLMDEAMAILVDISPALFELLKLRYIEKRTLSYIGIHHLKLSQRSANRHVSLAERLIYNILAKLYGSDKRYTLSRVLLDKSSIEKINYNKL